MDDNRRLALIRKRLAEILEEARSSSADHMEAMRAITADAWEDLRLRPTEVSVEEMQQLAAEIDRYAARRKFLEDDASAAIKMLKAPFFGRVDFEEKNCAPTSYYIGMHGLSDDKGGLLVCDWRAPVSELYYSKALGQTAYKSPMGMIEGTLTGKRQYHFEDGVLKYSVDTDVNIDDQMLLDILSESKSGPMKQIVATIQGEQDAAIRCDTERVLSVIGGAGSGKTGVALHRAAYLLYNHRESMTAEAMCILSPGTAFSEYISEVLPSLGERNIPAVTVHTIVEDVLKRKVESPSMRLNLLLERPTDERLSAVAEKDSAAFADRIEVFARNLVNRGYDFEDICLDGKPIFTKQKLKEMYRGQYAGFNFAQRMERLYATVLGRITDIETQLTEQYEREYTALYSGNELHCAARLAAAQRMFEARRKTEEQLNLSGSKLMKHFLGEDAAVYCENLENNHTRWEDAVAEAYLLVRLGFVKPNKSIVCLMIDEAQDYSETTLAFLHLWFPNAGVTLLGDPKQRTCPGMPVCDPDEWGKRFGEPSAPQFRLSRCYRATEQIAAFLNRLIPENPLVPFGRKGAEPRVAAYSEEAVASELARLRKAGYRTIAVLTQTQAEAHRLSERLENIYRLDDNGDDAAYETADNVVACYHAVKGLEFDAVIVAWPAPVADAEARRKMYVACSRALHELVVLTDAEALA